MGKKDLKTISIIVEPKYESTSVFDVLKPVGPLNKTTLGVQLLNDEEKSTVNDDCSEDRHHIRCS